LSSKGFSQKFFNELFDYDTQELELFSGVVQLKDSGYLSTGSSFKLGVGGNYYAVRTDKKGIKLYEKHYEIPFTEIYSVSPLKTINDSEFVAVGLIIDQDTNRNRINRDALLLKINQNGDTIWTKRFGLAVGTLSNPDFELANGIVITKDKGFAFTGYSNNFSAGNYQVYLVKTDSAGNLLWQKGYGGSSTDNAYSIIETQDKGFLLAGYTLSYGAGDRDGYLIKTDSLGNFQWQKTYGGGGNDGISGISKTNDGNYLLSGWYSYTSNNIKPWLIKINNSGIVVWDKKYGGSQTHGQFYNTQILNDSSIVVIGGIKDTVGMPYAGFIMKTKANGDSLWKREYKRSTTQDDYFYNLSSTNDGGFIMAGQVSSQGSPTNTQDAWLVKVDCNGADSITHYFGETCLLDPTVSIQELVLENNYPSLLNNYPNPFNENTVIPYYLPDNISEGTIVVTDIMGRVIQNYNLDRGVNKVEFNTDNLKNGIYYYTMKVDGKVISCKKMTLIK
jgi:hypothetical protein